MQETYKIKDLAQARLLADPLKLKLLQAFAEAPGTAKSVAAALGENVTKLYRHVDALSDAGLLVVVAENPKRGTVERTFRAVAQRFEADHSLFSDADGASTVRDMLRASEEEILDVLARAEAEAAADAGDDEQAVLMRIRGKASPEKIAELKQTLRDWLDSVAQAEDAATDDAREIGGLIAFYELPAKSAGAVGDNDL
jgi:predicted ArsR family transcriptional regulator